MASSALRLRRSVTTLSHLQLSFSPSSATCARPFHSPFYHAISSPSPLSQSSALLAQARAFKSSSISLLSARSSYNNDVNEIGPDTILFEGCDYNHWLIVMDFPKDPKPTPEQMVETYEQTCAKGLGISVEEAKKKIYACSTTTYTGFQCVVTEEESEKFNGLPGVIFVLPDSYIDPQNKEYGGDKYINGTIIPRPPPVQYARRRERTRNYDQPRNTSNNYQGFTQGDGRNHGSSQSHPPQMNYSPPSEDYAPKQSYNPPSQQNYGSAAPKFSPPQNYGPTSQQYAPYQNVGPAPTPGGAGAYQTHGGNPAPPGSSQNHPPQMNYSPPSEDYAPKQSYNPPSQQHAPQQNYGSAAPKFSPPQNYGPTSQQYAPHQNVGPAPTPGGAGAYQTHGGNPAPPYPRSFYQAGEGYSYPQEQRRSQQGYPAPDQGNLGAGSRNQGPVPSGNNGQGMSCQRTEDTYVQGANPGYGHNFSGNGEHQVLTREEHWNAQGAQRSFASLGQTGSEHGQGQTKDSVPTSGGAGPQGGNFAPTFIPRNKGYQQGYLPPDQSNLAGGNWNGGSVQNANYGQGMGYQGTSSAYSPGLEEWKKPSERRPRELGQTDGAHVNNFSYGN